MKKQLVIFASVLTLTSAAGLSAAGLVSAQSNPTKHSQSTTGKQHTKHVRREARLNQAVRDGTITSAQETAIKAELKTLKAERKAAISKSSTKAERQAERTKLKAELQSWATSNNFPLAKIFPKLAS